MKETIQSIIRHGLTILGGILVTKGLLDDATVTAVAGGLSSTVGLVWGAVDEYLAAKKAAGK
jgi:hypothetical protein